MSSRKQIEYMRTNVNPLYKMDEEEALNYAAGMGMSDTARGIAQLFGKGGEFFGADGLTNSLKEKDKKLQAILNHPEYGTKANIAFLSSAIVGDPFTYAPIAGWISKGKKAKNLYEFTKYGTLTSGIVGGVGYTSEDRALFIDDEASFAAKKAEQIGIAGLAGGIITAGGGKIYDVVSKAKGNKGLFDTDDVIINQSADDIMDAAEESAAKNADLQRGSRVYLPDRNNQGTVQSINKKKGTARVYIVNAETGKSVQKTFTLDELRPPKKGEPKKSVKVTESSKSEKVLEDKFIINKNNKRKGPIYNLYHEAKDTTYQISKDKDLKSGQFNGSWKVSRTVRKDNPMSDPSGEMGSFPKIVTDETMPTFKTLTEAKHFVKKTINPRYRKPLVLPKDESLDVIKKEVKKIDTPEEPKLVNPIMNMFANITSPSFKDSIFKGFQYENIKVNFKGEAGGAIMGGGFGYNTINDEDNFMTGFGKTMAGAFIGAGSANRIKFLDDKYSEGSFQESIGRNWIDKYGLTSEYLLDKKKFKTNKNRIAMEFLDIVNRAESELGKNESKLLLNFMVGDSSKIDDITAQGLRINADTRTLLVKYGQELVDLGVLNPKTFKNNIDTYLKRVYAPKAIKKGSPKILQEKIKTHNAIRTIGDQLKPRGVKPKTVLKTSWENPKKNYEADGWYIVSENGKKVTIRRDYTKTERQELGEIEDVALAIAETGRLLSNDISVLKFFKVIKDKYALTPAEFNKLSIKEQALYREVPKVQVQNTKANKYGSLAGLYVDRYTHNDLINTFRGVKGGPGDGIINNKAIRLYDTGLSIWKRTKTAWNFGTHVANTASNVILLDGADTQIKYLSRAFKEMRDPNSKIYKEAQLQGVMDADMVTNELSRKGSALERKLIAIQESKEPVESILGGVNKLLQFTKKHTTDNFEKAYQYEDHVFRMAVFMDRLDKGLSPEDAALEARKWFIDYDINAPAIQALKRTVLPFVSYTYRIAPLLAEIAAKRPVKFAKWSAIGYGLNELGMFVTEDKEGEELDRLTMRANDNKNMFGMPFMANAVIRMPFDSLNGDAMYLDVTRWMPGGDIFEKRESEGLNVPGLPSPIQPGGPLVDLAWMLTTKRDPFTGQDIDSINDSDTSPELLMKIGRHFFSKQLPNMPGIGGAGILPETYATEKLKKSLRLDRPDSFIGFKIDDESTKDDKVTGSSYATPYGPWEAFVYGLGIKLKPISSDVNMTVKTNEFNQEERQIRNRIKSNTGSYERGSIDKDEYVEKAESLELELFTFMAEKEMFLNTVLAAKLKYSIADAKKYNKKLAEEQPNFKTEKELTTKPKSKFFGGGIVDVPYTKDKPEDRVDSKTGKPFSDQLARLGFKRGGNVEKLTRIYDEDEGLKQVFPLVDLYTVVTGSKLLLAGGKEGAKLIGKGSSIAKEMVQQRNLKKTIPNIITHGSPTKNLKKYVKSGITVGSTKQAGIYGVGIKDSRVANNYAMGGFDSKNKRILGSRYNIDSSQYSDEAALTFKNIKKLKTNKVLDTSQPPASLVKLLDAEIKRTGNIAITTSSSRIAKRLKEKHISLRVFKDRLKKNNIDASYMSLIRPDVKNFLNKNNYNLMKQDHGKDFFTNEKINSYVFLKNKVPIMKNGETRLVQAETMPDPLKLTAMKKIFKD